MKRDSVRLSQVESSPESATPRKRSSARARGLAYQRKIRAFLEERGYQVQNIPPKSFRFFNPKTRTSGFASLRNDIFGCDLIAKRNDKYTLWIQATRHKSLKEKVRVLAQFPWAENERVLIFIYRESDRSTDIFEYSPKLRSESYQLAKLKGKKLFGLSPEGFYLFDKAQKGG